MALGLGNNLIRNGGSLNPDGLSLDLQFAADKTLTARKGPTPVFIRGSGDNGGTTYFAPSAINAAFTHSGDAFDVNTTQLTLSNGRYSWQNGDTRILYNGSRWVLSQNGETVATSALAENAWRPDLANWSGTGVTVAATSTFGIVKAANNEPRFDHNTTAPNACRGLLIEESRTNLILRSENFANASWTKTAGSISSVASVAPDGNANSELFSEDGTTASHRVFQSFAGTIGTVYTLSVFLKFNVRAEVSLENRSITGNPFAVFNIQNGTVGLVSPGLTAAIQAYPNGWYRCSITGTATLAGGNYLIAGYSVTGVYIGLNGPAFYIYGAQVEAGSFPTSYVPTTTASVVRSADVCSITGSGFSGFYNQPEGTLFADVTPPAVSQSACVLAVNVSTFFNQNGIYKNNAAFSGAGLRWGSTTVASVPIAEASIVTSTDVATSRSRLSYCYKLNDFALAYAGTIVGTDTSGVSPSPTTMHIGNRDGSLQINGHLASIRYYRKRLSNAKLQAITV